MENEKQIEVLLAEYNTLRQEMLARINNRFAFLTLASGVAAFWWGKGGGHSIGWVAFLALLLTLFAIWYWTGCLMEGISTGIQRIETDVNRLAGAELLRWES